MKLLIVGATGLVGGHLLERALSDKRIELVTAPVRRALPPHAKLVAPVVEFDHLPAAAAWWQADAVICALGTTIKAAGSQAAFRTVDHGYPLTVARLTKAHGARAFVLNSAMGADPGSRFFYNRVKGETERDLAALAFPSLTLVRPGLIGGERREPRTAERLASSVLGLFGPVLPRALRINPAWKIADAMVDAALAAQPGQHIVRSSDLV